MTIELLFILSTLPCSGMLFKVVMTLGIVILQYYPSNTRFAFICIIACMTRVGLWISHMARYQGVNLVSELYNGFLGVQMYLGEVNFSLGS